LENGSARRKPENQISTLLGTEVFWETKQGPKEEKRSEGRKTALRIVKISGTN
jgi:hypothetical protein